jgi:zinc transport system permease protein
MPTCIRAAASGYPMLDDFVTRALLGGIGVALAAGPLGAFVVWRRMAYFGEAIANAGLLGIVFGLLLQLDTTVGMLGFCLVLALLLVLLERQRVLPLDTAISILAHGALAVGLLTLSLIPSVRIDLSSYLFGDILAVSRRDLAFIAVVLAAVLITLAAAWRSLLSLTVDPDLAAVEGVAVERLRLLLTLMVAAVIAVGMKVVGILLIVSLLVMPAAAARRLARTPVQMAVIAALLGTGSVIGGLNLSLRVDVPTGPAVVAFAAAIFALLQFVRPRTSMG